MSRRLNADVSRSLRAILADSKNDTKDRLRAAELLIQYATSQAKQDQPAKKKPVGKNTAELRRLAAQSTEKPCVD